MRDYQKEYDEICKKENDMANLEKYQIETEINKLQSRLQTLKGEKAI
jgi:hypothetical protein